MKAWVLHDVGDIRCENIDAPEAGENEVLIAVKAAGICGSDIPRIYETGAHQMPLVVGHEFSGQVAGLGSGVGKEWENMRVGIFPLIPCGKCYPCLNKRYELCRNYNYIGSRCDGGFAEYAAAPVSNLIPLPDNISFENAAMLEPMAVAVHAIRQASVNSNDKVVVHGLGTIGTFVLMFLLDLGITDVFAVCNKTLQRNTALKLGVPEENICDCRVTDTADFIRERTVNGADVYFECVGKPETTSSAVSCSAPMGKVLLVGNPASDILLEKDVYWKILRNQLTVRGTWNSSFTADEADDWHYVLKRLSAGAVDPQFIISHTFPLDELRKGFEIMKNKTEEYGKIMALL